MDNSTQVTFRGKPLRCEHEVSEDEEEGEEEEEVEKEEGRNDSETRGIYYQSELKNSQP